MNFLEYFLQNSQIYQISNAISMDYGQFNHLFLCKKKNFTLVNNNIEIIRQIFSLFIVFKIKIDQTVSFRYFCLPKTVKNLYFSVKYKNVKENLLFLNSLVVNNIKWELIFFASKVSYFSLKFCILNHQIIYSNSSKAYFYLTIKMMKLFFIRI